MFFAEFHRYDPHRPYSLKRPLEPLGPIADIEQRR